MIKIICTKCNKEVMINEENEACNECGSLTYFEGIIDDAEGLSLFSPFN